MQWCTCVQLCTLTAWLGAFPIWTILMTETTATLDSESYWYTCSISLNQLLKLTVATKKHKAYNPLTLR